MWDKEFPEYIEVPEGYWTTTIYFDIDVEYLEKEN